jgi:N-acyl amino acid synthase of PEP-CTERM/exosortase system
VPSALQQSLGGIPRSPQPSLSVREGEFVVRSLSMPWEKALAYGLRHRIFCEELCWVPRKDNGLERDDYDRHAISLGLWDHRQQIRAYLRLIPAVGPFMLEKEFSAMVGKNHRIRKRPDTVEVSRLCVAPEARRDKLVASFGVANLSLLLYKGVYQWCLHHSVRFLYLVVETKIYRLLRSQGFPCEAIGNPVRMQDGVSAMAALLDWNEFKERNREVRPDLFQWFVRNQSGPARHRLQQLEPCLRHPVSVSHY